MPGNFQRHIKSAESRFRDQSASVACGPELIRQARKLREVFEQQNSFLSRDRVVSEARDLVDGDIVSLDQIPTREVLGEAALALVSEAAFEINAGLMRVLMTRLNGQLERINVGLRQTRQFFLSQSRAGRRADQPLNTQALRQVEQARLEVERTKSIFNQSGRLVRRPLESADNLLSTLSIDSIGLPSGVSAGTGLESLIKVASAYGEALSLVFVAENFPNLLSIDGRSAEALKAGEKLRKLVSTLESLRSKIASFRPGSSTARLVEARSRLRVLISIAGTIPQETTEGTYIDRAKGALNATLFQRSGRQTMARLDAVKDFYESNASTQIVISSLVSAERLVVEAQRQIRPLAGQAPSAAFISLERVLRLLGLGDPLSVFSQGSLSDLILERLDPEGNLPCFDVPNLAPFYNNELESLERDRRRQAVVATETIEDAMEDAQLNARLSATRISEFEELAS